MSFKLVPEDANSAKTDSQGNASIASQTKHWSLSMWTAKGVSEVKIKVTVMRGANMFGDDKY